MAEASHTDFLVVGSGFGGSVSALRLVEKGWGVRLLEKGRRFAPAQFPKTERDLPKWVGVPPRQSSPQQALN